MNPKMVILNEKEYNEKFDMAFAYSLEEEHQKALKILLELKEQRWIKFELFYQIAKEYIYLSQFDQARIIIKKLNSFHTKDKEKIIELQEFLDEIQSYCQIQLKQTLQEDQLFVETNQMKQFVSQTQINDPKNFQMIYDQILASHSLGLFSIVQIIVEKTFGPDLSGTIELENNGLSILNRSVCFENYQMTLNISDIFEQNYKILFLKAFCYLQLKQYKLSLNLFYQSFSLNQNIDTYAKISYLQSLLCQKQEKFANFRGYNTLSLYLIYYQMNKHCKYLDLQIKQQITNELKYEITSHNNSALYLYHELFNIEYEFSHQSPILQRICDFMIKYSPKYPGGYSDQYQLYIDQKQLNRAYALLEPLQNCDNSALKYITIAKIYKEQQNYSKSHQALEKAQQINRYNEEIYLIRRDLFISEQKYQQAYLTTKELIKLEKENCLFVCTIISQFINRYEYYRIIDLLSLVDQDSKKFNELKVLIKILCHNNYSEDESINQDILSLDPVVRQLYFGIICSLNSSLYAVQFYQKSILQAESSVDIYQLQKKINSFGSKDNISEQEIVNIICQISIPNYMPAQDHINLIYQRYINTIGFVLTSIVYSDNQNEIVKFINSNYDVEVPYITDFKQHLASIIEDIFCQNWIMPKTYQNYLEKVINQLKNLFISIQIFYLSFNEFCEKYKQNIIEKLGIIKRNPIFIDENLKIIFAFPFFYDPISKLALLKVIKIIGYFIEFEQVNNYEKTQQLLELHLLKDNNEEYYKIHTQTKQKIIKI